VVAAKFNLDATLYPTRRMCANSFGVCARPVRRMLTQLEAFVPLCGDVGKDLLIHRHSARE
jgi:hypothetical protein